MFPLLKPLSVSKGEVIFERGTPSTDLIFLLDGEVEVLSELDDATPVRRLRHNQLEGEHGAVIEELLSFDFEDEREALKVRKTVGCFGESVLVGHRRKETHKAVSPCQLLIITKADLATLFEADPASARVICNDLLKGHSAHVRLRALAFKFRLAACSDKKLRASLIIQRSWRRFSDNAAQEHDDIYKFVAAQTLKRQEDLALQRGLAGKRPLDKVAAAMTQMARQHTMSLTRAAAASAAAPASAAPSSADADTITLRRDIFEMMMKDLDRPAPDESVAAADVKQLFDAMMRRVDHVENKMDTIFQTMVDKIDKAPGTATPQGSSRSATPKGSTKPVRV